MSTPPYFVRLAPGSTPQIEERLPTSAAETSLSAIQLQISSGRESDRTVYWSALRDTQSFYGRPSPSDSDLERAVLRFQDEAREQLGGLVVAEVALGTDGTIYVMGHTGVREQRDGAVVISVEPADDVLSPRSEWQKQALGTNARASLDAFRRSLDRRGAHDAIVHQGRAVRPIVGALVLRVGDVLRTASATTVIPDLFEAWLQSGGIAPRDGVTMMSGLSGSDVHDARSGWWISPEFEVWHVHDIAGRVVPETRDLREFLAFS